jgi:hypothetical protein
LSPLSRQLVVKIQKIVDFDRMNSHKFKKFQISSFIHLYPSHVEAHFTPFELNLYML